MGLDGSSALLKTQWLEGSEKPAKYYQNWGQDPRGYYCLFPGHHYCQFLSNRFLHRPPKFFQYRLEYEQPEISNIIKKISYKFDKSVINKNDTNVKVHLCKYIANNVVGYLLFKFVWLTFQETRNVLSLEADLRMKRSRLICVWPQVYLRWSLFGIW